MKLNVIEERTIGPELGKDSIEKGIIASVAATFAVILFMRPLKSSTPLSPGSLSR